MTKTATVLNPQSSTFSARAEIELLMTGLTIDTICRLALYLASVGVEVSKVKPVLKAEDLQGQHCLESDAIVGQRYRDCGRRSATEQFALENLDGGGQVLGLRALCEMLADNNGCGQPNYGGYLKGLPHSFAQLLRLVGRIESLGTTEAERIKNALPIVIRIPQTFLAFCEHVGGHLLSLWAGTFDKAVPGILKELSVTWDKLNKPEDLLTLPGYLVALYALGATPEEIRVEYAIWKQLFAQAKAVKQASRDVATAVASTVRTSPQARFALPNGHLGVAVADVDDNIAADLWRKLNPAVTVLVLKKTTGHVAVMPRYGVVIGFGDLVAQLNEREPGRWHHETRFNGGTSSMALNGGGKMAGGTEATSLSSDELVVAIRHFGRFPRRQLQTRRQGR